MRHVYFFLYFWYLRFLFLRLNRHMRQASRRLRRALN